MTIVDQPTLAGVSRKKEASPWLVFSIASVAVFLVSLDGTMLYSVFSALRRSFPSATAADMSWVLNAYTIVYATMLIPSGGLSDAHGHKRLFLIGIAVFIASSAACGLSGTVGALVLARAIQAVGAALLMPASLSLVLGAFPQSQRALTVSAWGAVGGFAAAIGPSLGSAIAVSAGWSWAFLINVPIGLASIWFGARHLAASPTSGRRQRVDLVGMILLIVAVGAIALAIVEADSPTWTAQRLALTAGGGVLALGLFVLWAKRATAPLIDLGLFKNRTYTAVNLATLTFGAAFSIMFFAFFFYMTRIWHMDEARAGLAIAPGPLTVVPVAILTGRLARRFGHRPFLVGGALLHALSGLWLVLIPGTEPAYFTHWLPGLLMSGMAVGLVMPSLSGAAVSKLPPSQYSIGSAVNQAARQIGSSVGVALIILLLGHSQLTRGDLSRAYAWQIGLALSTAVLCLFVNTRPAPAISAARTNDR